MNTHEAKAQKTRGTFRMDCAIRATIQATPEKIWSLLTDAAAFPRWNSTVTSIEGTIAAGQTLKVKVPSAPSREFTPKVSAMAPGRSMVWSDGMAPMFRGLRTFELTPNPDGSTEFTMREELSGLMLPMIKGSLPDFAPIFETYAADLKRAAEERGIVSAMGKVKGLGTAAKPWELKTPPGTSDFQAYRDDAADPPALVVQVGKTQLRYHVRCIDDLHAMLKKSAADDGWVVLGSADEQKPAAEGTVEAWGRSSTNPVKGWYGLKKGLRGRFGMYVPPVLEALGLAEVEHNPKNNRMRALAKGK